MTEKSACPVCGHDDCDRLVIDLNICNNCSHIFKHEPEMYDGEPDLYSGLHFCAYPVKDVRNATENLRDGTIVEFIFPTTNFYSLDLQPNNFYKSSINQYFNQVSSMILLKRCGLMPIAQQNYWNKEGKICITKLVCKKGDEI